MTDVTQRTDHDCVLCCLAMALGLSYDEAAARAGAAFIALLEARGCSDEMEGALFRAFGLTENVDYAPRRYSPHWATIAYTKNMLWGRRALLTVRSRNNPEGWHMIYWDGTAVRDPSAKKRYEDWAEVEPLDIVLFRETRP